MAEIQESGGGKGKHGGKVRGKKHSTKIDMTPMVDLAFLLLTFFIMTTTFAKPKTMQINMPEKPKPNDPPPPDIPASKTLTVILGKNDQVFWYQGKGDTAHAITTNFGPEGIRRIIAEKKRTIPPKMIVLIKMTDEARYKNMVDILDEMNINTIERYAIVDLDANDKKLIPNQ